MSSLSFTTSASSSATTSRFRLRHSHCLYWLLLILCIYFFGLQQGLQLAALDEDNDYNIDVKSLGLWESFLDIVLVATNDDDMYVHNDGEEEEEEENPPADDDGVEEDEDGDGTRRKKRVHATKPRFQAPEHLKLPKPIINVGFPKAGTSTIFEFFHCNGLKSQHWFCCEEQNSPSGTETNKLMSRCVLDNIIRMNLLQKETTNRTTTATFASINNKANITIPKHILDGCGDYDVYTEINGPRSFKDYGFWVLLDDGQFAKTKRPRLLMPQHHYLDQVHQAFPNATFLLNQRPVNDWVNSVLNWPTSLKSELPFEFYAQRAKNPTKFGFDMPDGVEKDVNGMAKALEFFYNYHNDFVREFVKNHPSHTLIEVDITHNDTGIMLAERFGLNETCWGHANKNKKGKGKGHKGKGNNMGLRPMGKRAADLIAAKRQQFLEKRQRNGGRGGMYFAKNERTAPMRRGGAMLDFKQKLGSVRRPVYELYQHADGPGNHNNSTTPTGESGAGDTGIMVYPSFLDTRRQHKPKAQDFLDRLGNATGPRQQRIGMEGNYKNAMAFKERLAAKRKHTMESMRRRFGV